MTRYEKEHRIGLAWIWPVVLGSFLAGTIAAGLAILGVDHVR
jgi:hypothetical protein